jgi:hypothetical protein
MIRRVLVAVGVVVLGLAGWALYALNQDIWFRGPLASAFKAARTTADSGHRVDLTDDIRQVIPDRTDRSTAERQLAADGFRCVDVPDSRYRRCTNRISAIFCADEWSVEYLLVDDDAVAIASATRSIVCI